MDKLELIDFFAISIPEQFLMVFFVWVILGLKKTVKKINVITASFVAAISFRVIYIAFINDFALVGILQVAAFTLIIYFLLQLSYIEAIIGSLLTTIVIAVVQSSVVYVEFLLTGIKYNELKPGNLLKVLLTLPEYGLVMLLVLILLKKEIRLFSFKGRNKDKVLQNKIRYLALQLTFAFLIIIFNYTMFVHKKEAYIDNSEKMMLAISMCIIIVFTVLVIRGAIKVSDIVKQQEEMKRRFDSIEFAQNIDFICALMERKEYEEANSILKSIKDQIDYSILDKSIINGKGGFNNEA